MAGFRGIPCTDTVFIRGFSAKRRVEDIRKFFLREAGHNGVEFCRESNEGNLLLALKFDSRAIAKEVIDRFNDIDVLGDRISVCWYKEMRKSYINNMEQGSYRRGPQNQQWGQDRSYDNRGTRGDGPSYRSQIVGGSRFPRIVSRGDDRPGHRRLQSRSTSGSRSRSKSPQSHRSRTASSSNDERASRSKSGGSRDRSREHRSSSDGINRNRSSHKVKSKPGRDAKKNMAASDSSQSDDDTNVSLSPQLQRKKKKQEEKLVHRNINSLSEHSSKNEDSSGSSSEDERPPVNSNVHSQQVSEQGAPVGRSALKSAVQTAPTVKKVNDLKTPIDSEFTQEQSSSAESSGEDSSQPAFSPTASGDTTGSKAWQPKSTKVKHEQHNDNFSEADFTRAEIVRKVHQAQVHQNETILAGDSANQRTNYSPSSMNNELDDRGFKMPNAVPPFGLKAKKRKSVEDRRLTEIENSVSKEGALKRTRVVSKDAASDSKGVESLNASKSASKKKPSSESANWFPPGKMSLVHEKKAEIEKAYKQDCETFATVTKMLISKDPGIEDRIQASLRENLKEIGQRCIQELRDFIETLRDEEQDGDD